jgi:hypothetical protein
MRSKSRAKRSNTELNPLIGDFINTIGQTRKFKTGPFLRFRCRLSISGEQTRLLRGNTEQAPRTRSWQSRKAGGNKKLDNGGSIAPATEEAE